MRKIGLGCSILLLVTACSVSTDDAPPAPPVIPDARALAGTYHVVSSFEVPATAGIPGPLGDSLRLVHDLSVNPADALLDVAEEAGVPALDTLRLVLPGVLQAQLEGWMNGYLEAATVDGVPVHDRIVELDGQIRSVLLQWELRSDLELPAPAAGTHAPRELAFHVLPDPIVIPVGATAPVTAGTNVRVTVWWPDGAERAARVTVSDHGMGIPFGRYALEALHVLFQEHYGAGDLRGALNRLVDCAGMASSVGARCLGPVCVGHEAELAEVCDAGLDGIAAQVEARILELNYDAIHLQSGDAAAPGAVVDPATGLVTADGFLGGVWTATVDLGQGEEQATATFTAAR